jgi:flagellar biogenesis protein FliO
MEPLRTIAALAITFCLLGGALWILRFLSSTRTGRELQWPRSAPRRQLQLVEKLALGPNGTLHLVAVNGELILLAISSHAIVSIQPTGTPAQHGRAAGGAA